MFIGVLLYYYTAKVCQRNESCKLFVHYFCLSTIFSVTLHIGRQRFKNNTYYIL